MASKSYHVLKAKGVPERFSLSRNIMSLLNARDNFNSGQIDATELGRLVRLSPNRRSAIANTISKCAEMIKKHPEEVKTCVELIEMCTEILEIAGEYQSALVGPLANTSKTVLSPRRGFRS